MTLLQVASLFTIGFIGSLYRWTSFSYNLVNWFYDPNASMNWNYILIVFTFVVFIFRFTLTYGII